MGVVDAHTHLLPAQSVTATGVDADGCATYEVAVTDVDGRLVVGSGTATGFDLDQLTDPDRRRHDMRQSGVDHQILSVPPPFGFAYGKELPAAIRISRQLNDGLAAVAAADPEHFTALATLPLQDVAAAEQEAYRAKAAGIGGFSIGTHVGLRNLDDPDLRQVLTVLESLELPVFVHSTRGFGADRLPDHHFGNLIGNPAEDALAVASLIFGGVLDALPRLQLYIAHAGGGCTQTVGRWDRGAAIRTEVSLPAPPSSYLRRLRFDSLTHDALALEHLVARVGADRVLLGSDYPYDMADPDPVGTVRSARLDESAQHSILEGTAAALFAQLDPAAPAPSAH